MSETQQSLVERLRKHRSVFAVTDGHSFNTDARDLLLAERHEAATELKRLEDRNAELEQILREPWPCPSCGVGRGSDGRERITELEARVNGQDDHTAELERIVARMDCYIIDACYKAPELHAELFRKMIDELHPDARKAAAESAARGDGGKS